MAKNQFFKNVLEKARRNKQTDLTKESINWFRKNVKAMSSKTSRKELMREGNLKDVPRVGDMYMYYYDPKWKKKLPYYDRFPLTIIIENKGKYLLGLNLHYLSPKMRGQFLSKLMDVTNNDQMDQTTRFRVTYGMLKDAAKYKEFKPCIKKYLKTHVQSRYLRINADSWIVAVFLPFAQFKKAAKSKIWSDSRQKM